MEDNPLKIRERISKVKTEVVNLDDKIEELIGLIGHSPFDEPPSSIFIYGDSGTGKSLTLQKCLGINDFLYATVNCVESYSVKLIFESILNQLSNHKMSSENKFQPYAKCGNMLDFVIELKKLSEKLEIGGSNQRSIILVFDKSEKLRNLSKNFVPALVKLREFSYLKICTILVSSIPWDRYFTQEYISQPITLFFGQYDQKQLLKILALSKPNDVSSSFYESFLNLFLSVFYSATHDVRELLYQAKMSFNHYYEPITSGELTENDSGQLWKRCQVYFKKALRSLYLKVDSTMELSEVENITSVTTQALIMELPYYSKYILIGAYLASYNPAALDRRIFEKNSGKTKKMSKTTSASSKTHLFGPKPFALQRLFAIVSSILNDKKFNLNADLFMEVQSLIQMKLITQVSDDTLDGPTFKCNVGLQFIDVISKNVQFPIRKYLIDFMEA